MQALQFRHCLTDVIILEWTGAWGKQNQRHPPLTTLLAGTDC